MTAPTTTHVVIVLLSDRVDFSLIFTTPEGRDNPFAKPVLHPLGVTYSCHPPSCTLSCAISTELGV
eukprot:scaffold12212_cov73-Skeletonema_dohrnii-CCMP3373.AAC.3